MQVLVAAFLVGILLSSCAPRNQQRPQSLPYLNATTDIAPIPPDNNPVSNATNTLTRDNETEGVPALPITDEWHDAYDDGCTADRDCVVMREGYCGGARGIMTTHVDAWNVRLKGMDERDKGMECKVTLPLSSFEARCISGECRAVQVKDLPS